MKTQDNVGQEIRDLIKELGQKWKFSKNAINISIDILDSWEKLITEWIEDENMPLIVRKGVTQRGREINHPSGRKVIFSDNTFAIWVYCNVMEQKIFNISEIRRKLNNNEIPMSFALTKKEKDVARYTKTLGANALSDWKLCHIEPVGLNNRKDICDLGINEIKSHFEKYANPKNMFALPKEIGGLGEIQEFINEQKHSK